jgi:hypothetical protein
MECVMAKKIENQGVRSMAHTPTLDAKHLLVYESVRFMFSVGICSL